MDALQSLLLQMAKGLSLEEQREKLEFGGLPNKLKLWRLLSRNIEAKFGLFK